MVDNSVQKQTATGIPSYALVFKGASILLIEEGETLVVPEDMGDVGIDAAVFALVANVELSNGEVIFEGVVFRIVDCLVGSVVPKSTILVTVMHGSRHIFEGVLSGGEVEDIVGYVKIESFFLATTALAIIVSDVSTFRIKTVIKAEPNSLDPSVMQLIIDPYFELDVTVVCQIHKLDLEEIPVIKGEVVGVYFFVKVEPRQRGAALKVGFGKGVFL